MFIMHVSGLGIHAAKGRKPASGTCEAHDRNVSYYVITYYQRMAEATNSNEALAALEARVRKLELDQAQHHQSSPAQPATTDPLWALSELRSRLPEHPDTHRGAVMIVGSLTLPDETPVSWQESASTDSLLEIDWSEHASAFAALGHPVRLELLRHLLSGVRTTAELVDIGFLGTTGQLHHHLRQLVSAGWVRQTARGAYEVPAARVVPLFACLTGGQR